ncbi:beta-N-acetylhexosaminidase [Mucilaginibacter terrigena]|nr:family 20 glycosylhydrolase [Mucilaginibacter terrigena]
MLTSLSLYAQQVANKNLGIIPAPASVVINKGVFDLNKTAAIIYDDNEGHTEAQLLHHFLLQSYKLDIPVVNGSRKAGVNVISFSSAGYAGKNPEGYTLTVTASVITISGKGAGLFYGLQSLMQIIDTSQQGIPCAVINDEPRYAYRGIMQDVGYHIFPVDFIKKQIDMMAKYKMNTYHWHLTEDHGWRIEIKKYPRLTSVGAYRAQSPVSNYNNDMSGLDGTPYGGFYTQAQVRDIVKYATERHVTIIPEIELPGHSLAALAAYPELACGDNPGPFKVAENWGIYDDVYCAGKDYTFDFLEDVLTEVMGLFPGKYIHIGGDESPKYKWEKCKYCQKRIKDNHLKDEHELQSYFIRRIEKFVNSKGRDIIGWDEILEGGLAPKATVMSWRGIKGGISAAKQGHDVVMASESHLYFDFIQGPRELEPIAIGVGYNPLPRVYAFNPTPAALTPAEQKHIIGVEAPLWTEHMETPAKVEYMLYPRLFALVEISWTPVDRKDYEDFAENRLPQHLLLLDKAGTVYRVPTPIGQKDTTLWGADFTLTLKAPVENAQIYYNTDGQDVRETDHIYAKPLHIVVPEGEMRQLKTMVIAPSGKRSIVTTTTLVNKAASEPAQINISSLKPGIKYFYISGKLASVDYADSNKVTQKGIATEPDLQKFDSETDHALIYKGYINITSDGVYTFAMPSVGCSVRIDDEQGVRNSNIYNPFDLQSYQYQEKTVSYNLKKGMHKIQIKYIPSDAGNRVRMAGTNGAYESLKDLVFTGK